MVNNKPFELFASLWACSRTGLCALCCLSASLEHLNCTEWTFTKWASRYWTRCWKHKEDGDSFSPVCNDMAIWLSYSCPREETNMSRRKGLFYLNSVKAKKSRWKGHKTAQSQAWLRAEWASACFWVSSLSPLLRSLGNSATDFNKDNQDNPLQTRQQASLS